MAIVAMSAPPRRPDKVAAQFSHAYIAGRANPRATLTTAKPDCAAILQNAHEARLRVHVLTDAGGIHT